VIHADEVLPMLLAAVPSFADPWRELEDDPIHVDEETGHASTTSMPVTSPAILVIDGDLFDDFEGFVREFSAKLDDFSWQASLDAFNDIMRGGCGTPDGGFEFRWLNSERSRLALGWPATIRWLEETLARCHSSNVPRLTRELGDARLHKGTTLFDWIIEMIRDHGAGGSEPERNVYLRLL
jgi:hypothetical protein